MNKCRMSKSQTDKILNVDIKSLVYAVKNPFKISKFY